MTFCLITLVTTPGIHVVYIFSFIHVILKKRRRKKVGHADIRKTASKIVRCPLETIGYKCQKRIHYFLTARKNNTEN